MKEPSPSATVYELAQFFLVGIVVSSMFAFRYVIYSEVVTNGLCIILSSYEPAKPAKSGVSKTFR